MKTLIKTLITICLIFIFAAFAFSSWCAYNSLAIGDVTQSLIHTTLAVADLFFLISSILLFTK